MICFQSDTPAAAESLSTEFPHIPEPTAEIPEPLAEVPEHLASIPQPTAEVPEPMAEVPEPVPETSEENGASATTAPYTVPLEEGDEDEDGELPVDFERLWRVAHDNPQEFSSWTELLQYCEQEVRTDQSCQAKMRECLSAWCGGGERCCGLINTAPSRKR